MGAEYLIKMISSQITEGTAGGQGLLRTHQNGIGEAAQQHDQGQDNIHDADLFVIEAGQPFPVQVGPPAVIGDQGGDHQAQETCTNYGNEDDHIVVRDC